MNTANSNSGCARGGTTQGGSFVGKLGSEEIGNGDGPWKPWDVCGGVIGPEEDEMDDAEVRPGVAEAWGRFDFLEWGIALKER